MPQQYTKEVISEINPLVDDKGMVKVKARVTGPVSCLAG